MRRFRVYVDTSVLGGCFDAEFSEWSNSLVQDFRLGRFVPVLSDVVAAEVALAPGAVRDLHDALLRLPAEVVSVSPEALRLVSDSSVQRRKPRARPGHAEHLLAS